MSDDVDDDEVGLGFGEDDLIDMLFLLDLSKLEIDLLADTDAEEEADEEDEEGGGLET